MLQVVGAGLPHTGTTSTKAALERLGFGPCYHMFEILTHPDHVDRWLPAAEGEIEDWDRVLAGYRSTQDWPASYFWRELAAAYPDAKVVLTVRDPHAWFPSMRMLMAGPPAALASGTAQDLPEPVRNALAGMQRLRPVLELIGRSYFGPDWHFGQEMTDEAQAVEAFERHVATVREAVPPERLLVFDVREGWQPLCTFLRVPVPDEPFPHLNEGQSMREAFARVRSGVPLSSVFDGSVPRPAES
ncbi:MAG: sulfotransferase family protein [Actinomycetes bacterium]